MDRYLMVMLGAAAGGLARYLVSSAVMRWYGGQFPLGTLTVNITGCFLAGVIIMSLAGRLDLHDNVRLFLVVGILGGYTTFSSFAWETFQSIRDVSFASGLANVVLSVVLGYVAVWCGAWLVRR